MPMRTRLIRYGNSRALRIPKAVLKRACFREDEELKLTVEEGCITIRPLRRKLTLACLVATITPENQHGESDWGPPVGDEIW